jgi:hypothetical protein
VASPKPEVFFLYDAATGAPKPGHTGIAFAFYKDDLGVNVTPQPAISEIGGGAYKFTPVFADPARGIAYDINTNGSSPLHVARYMRPEDYAAEDALTVAQRLRLLQEGRWKIETTGPNMNTLALYGADGLTVIQRWELFDAAGDPATTELYERVPTEPIA